MRKSLNFCCERVTRFDNRLFLYKTARSGWPACPRNHWRRTFPRSFYAKKTTWTTKLRPSQSASQVRFGMSRAKILQSDWLMQKIHQRENLQLQTKASGIPVPLLCWLTTWVCGSQLRTWAQQLSIMPYSSSILCIPAIHTDANGSAHHTCNAAMHNNNMYGWGETP